MYFGSRPDRNRHTSVLPYRQPPVEATMILTVERALNTRNATAETREDNSGRAIILVVNDVEEVRDALEELLTADGYHVDPARSEEDAVRTARASRPHLI
jgi:CheY-like chemotaxis protein